MANSYRLPRKYRYRRKGKLTSNQAIAAVVVVVAAAAASGSHKTAAGAVRHAEAGIHAVTVASGSQDSFIRAVLADLGAPATQADITSLASWFPHEGTAAENNPMASTMPEPGATVFNYDGVRNYVSPSQGAEATAATLDNGLYPGIVADLRSGRGLCGDPSLAGEFLKWSGDGYSGVC